MTTIDTIIVTAATGLVAVLAAVFAVVIAVLRGQR